MTVHERGVETLVTTNVAGQAFPSIVGLPGGSYVVAAWSDPRSRLSSIR
jgi:hypothetical protein